MQCFYYLLPRGSDRHNTNSQDPDPKVSELSRVLTSIDEAMTSSLQPRKSKVSVMLGNHIFDHHLDKIHNNFIDIFIENSARVNKKIQKVAFRESRTGTELLNRKHERGKECEFVLFVR